MESVSCAPSWVPSPSSPSILYPLVPKARIFVRPFASVLSGSYFSSVRENRSKTLPWPPVILAIISLPQKTAQVISPINTRTINNNIEVIIRRALDGFFLVLDFLSVVLVDSFISLTLSLLFLSSPESSKSNAWTGLRKSSTFWVGVMSEVSIFEDVVVLVVESVLVETGEEVLVVGCFDEIGTFLVDFLVLAAAEIEAFFWATLTAASFLASRVVSPSIDLFVFIIYNYTMKTSKLTKKQLAVLDFLQEFTEEKGLSPSYREIQAGLGLSSVSAVAEHIDNLVAKGVLKKVPGAARSLEILDYKHEDTVELFKVTMLSCSDEEKKVLLKAADILGIDVE